jgi:hypothetical protein
LTLGAISFAYGVTPQGDPKHPVAAAAGTFMLGTKGKATRAHGFLGKSKP